jgi:hypothetical protein
VNWASEKLNEEDEDEIAMEQATVCMTNLNQLPGTNSKGEPLIFAIEKYKLEIHNCVSDITPWDDISLRLLKYLLTSHVFVLEILVTFPICHQEILEHCAAKLCAIILMQHQHARS